MFGSSTTNPDGSYRFEVVPWENYTINETLKSGWKQIAPERGTHVVVINARSLHVTGKDFGNFLVRDCCA